MSHRLATLLITAILVAGIAAPASAGVELASELLLPYFVIDLGNPAGTTTLFSLGNAAEHAVSVRIEVYSNWGIRIVDTTLWLESDEVRSINLRDWVGSGKLADRQLFGDDLTHVQAALTGKRSPTDDLYYSSTVDDGRAAGYVSIKVESAEDVLFGDFFVVDPSQDYAQGSLLVNMGADGACGKGLCDRHALRYLNGGGFDGGTEVVVWTGVQGSPSSDGLYPTASQTEVGAEFYNEPGDMIDSRSLDLLPVQVINIADLDLDERFGWMALEADVEFWVGVSYSAQSRFSVGFDTFCLPRKRQPGPGIELEKSTNGSDADFAPGPSISAGSKVVWTYEVTNTGAVDLFDIVVADDDPALAISCPKDTLAPAESMTCRAEGTAHGCQYRNLGSVSAADGDGSRVSDTDASHYFGESHAAIDLEKATNGSDADRAPGIELAAGDAVEWTYVITNTGDAPLVNIRVSDDQEGPVACPADSLEPGESMTCSLAGIAAEGEYANVGFVRAETECGSDVVDDDASHYWVPSTCSPASIEVEKATNGFDADSAPGPMIPVGDGVQWTYVVTNTGKADLVNVSLEDDQLGTVSCPETSLASGESMTCRASGLAEACQYTNVALVSAASGCDGSQVSDSDASHYFGQTAAAIRVEKATNGFDADAAPGPGIEVGSLVTWTYVVTNTGDVALSGVALMDDEEGPVACPKSSLEPGESMTCSASGAAVAGQYANLATVTATAACGDGVSDSDPSHYYGESTAAQGCTPGYWKNHADSWPAAGYSPNQSVASVFADASAYPDVASASLIAALGFNGGSGVDGAVRNLMRAAVAGLLDASHPGVNYPGSAAGLIAQVNAALATGDRDTMLALAASIDRDNNLGCPLN